MSEPSVFAHHTRRAVLAAGLGLQESPPRDPHELTKIDDAIH
jgi:hypothetical protein